MPSRILKYDKSCGTNLYDNIFTTVSCGNVIMSIDDKISVNTIRTIDDYNFVNYSIYVFIAITFLLFFMLLPYMKVFRKNVRFIIQNKKFEKYLKDNNSDAEWFNIFLNILYKNCDNVKKVVLRLNQIIVWSEFIWKFW